MTTNEHVFYVYLSWLCVITTQKAPASYYVQYKTSNVHATYAATCSSSLHHQVTFPLVHKIIHNILHGVMSCYLDSFFTQEYFYFV